MLSFYDGSEQAEKAAAKEAKGMQCPSCEFANPAGFLFCGCCGQRLGGQTSASFQSRLKHAVEMIESDAEVSLFAAERRQLTVMFCDLVGSTPLAEQLDPEDLREVLQAYQEVCAEEIRSFAGYIARYFGDGLLVYFGYPMAYEDAAQRAVQAALGIVAKLPSLNRRLQLTTTVLRHRPLQMRIGIHTGLVVVGEMGSGARRDYSAVVGETPNIAARLQEMAPPDTVVVSAATARLLEGHFTLQDGGPQRLKGVSTPVCVYRVQGERKAKTRLEVTANAGLTPLVGREQEVRLLTKCWEQVVQGLGQVVMLSGEPGIGKSRLVRVLKEQLATQPRLWIECRCSPYHQNSALYPALEWLQRGLHFGADESPRTKLRKLERALRQCEFFSVEAFSLLAVLLSLPLPEGQDLSLPLTPQKQRQKTLETLVALLLKAAEQKPVVLVIEDLQWADPSTLEVLNLLIDQIAMSRIFVLQTFRPEFSPLWTGRSFATQLSLTRLSPRQGESMITEIAGDVKLPVEVLHQIVIKTDGVPLFVEELTKMVVESGLFPHDQGQEEPSGRLSPLSIPATLHDSLMARLDRLARGREVAQLAATIGREFSYELIETVSQLDRSVLQRDLAALVEAELLYQRGTPPLARYFFKHALIQEAAYQSLLKSKRRQYHRQIAQVLEERFPETRNTHPDLMAYHYGQAGLNEQAISYWRRAGQQAIERSANAEAIHHLSTALELLKLLPDTPERARQELMLQTTSGIALMTTKGFAAPEVERAYTRARYLCHYHQIEKTPELVRVLRGLFSYYLVRGELEPAHELAAEMLSSAKQTQDPVHLLEGNSTLGFVSFYRGEQIQARMFLEQSIALYEAQFHQRYSHESVQDPGVDSLCILALSLWILGYPDQALRRSRMAVTLARKLAHPFSMAYAAACTAALHWARQEETLGCAEAETAIAIATEYNFPFCLTLGSSFRGWALLRSGHTEEGMRQLQQGIAAFQTLGVGLLRPYLLVVLAEECQRRGQLSEALSCIAEVLNLVGENKERFYEAELCRVRGEVVLQGKNRQWRLEAEKEAEEYFTQAIRIARGQGAKAWELRAAVSLSRLWSQQGKGDKARRVLSEIYGWFTEGFETKDLQDAKLMLRALS